MIGIKGNPSFVPNDLCLILLDRLTNRLFRSSDLADFDHLVLQKCFERTLSEFKILRLKIQEKITDQEKECVDFEDRFRNSMDVLKNKIENVKGKFDQLDDKVRIVSGKTINLTDQLEKINTPRVRLEEAREMILEFYKYLNAGGASVSNLATQSSADINKLLDAAVKIRKLHSLCMELPNGENFLAAKQRVELGSQHIHIALRNAFKESYKKNDIYVLHKIADIMSQSQNANICIDIFIDGLLASMPADLGTFRSLINGFGRAEEDIYRVFNRPDHVMNLLMQSFFTKRLKGHLSQKLDPLKSNHDIYLKELYELYINVNNLIINLTSQPNTILVMDPLLKLNQDLFHEYLEDYSEIEFQWFIYRINVHFQKFYAENKHTKRVINQAQLNGLKNRWNLMDEDESNAIKRVLVSQGVAVNILEDSKKSYTRIKTLLNGDTRNNVICQLQETLVEKLVKEHILYGLEVAYQGIPTLHQDNAKFPIFLEVISEAIASTELLTKFCYNHIIPLINKSATHFCQAKDIIAKNRIEVEAKINLGLIKLNQEVIEKLQNTLKTYQKRQDFKIDDSTNPADICSASAEGKCITLACERVCRDAEYYINELILQLDQNNASQVLKDFGGKFLRIVTDNFYNYTYTVAGGIRAMYDTVQYRDIGYKTKDPKIIRLFDVLTQMVNLFLIQKDNLDQVCQDHIKNGIPREIIFQFLSLRQDCKSEKSLQIKLKGLRLDS